MKIDTPVYLDHHATTPVAPEVVEVMTRTLRDHFGNPASASHSFGWAAKSLVHRAREQVAELLGCLPREVVFTSGATESNRLALFGVCDSWHEPGRIIASNLEHAAVSMNLVRLIDAGWEIVMVSGGRRGVVEPGAVAEVLNERTRLVTVLAAQNEIGTLQPWRELAALCRERGVPFHTDAAQAVGKVPLHVTDDGIGLLSCSAHKFYGPKGVGALYVRSREPRIGLVCQAPGGGQEGGMRSGTLNVPGIVGMGEAARLALERREDDARRLRGYAAGLYARLADSVPDIRLNGDASRRLPGSLSLTVPGVTAAALIAAVPVLAFSSGAACGGEDGGSSSVLGLIGLSDGEAANTVRLCFGRGNTEAEAEFAAGHLVRAILELRKEKGTA